MHLWHVEETLGVKVGILGQSGSAIYQFHYTPYGTAIIIMAIQHCGLRLLNKRKLSSENYWSIPCLHFLGAPPLSRSENHNIIRKRLYLLYVMTSVFYECAKISDFSSKNNSR